VTNKVRSIPRYSVTILPGGTNTTPARINNKGHVVGVSDGKAFLYDGQMRLLGTLGGAHSAATSINNNDQIVGVSEDGEGIQRAFLWEAERGMAPMAVTANATPADINDVGDVVGSGSYGSFLYRSGHELPLPLATPLDFNNYGMAVGGGIYNTDLRARWDEFYRLYWGVFGEDGPARISVSAINDANEVAGTDESSVGGGRNWTIYAYRYGAYERKRVTPWGGKAAPRAINRWGDIVGSYRKSSYGLRGSWESDGPPHAFLTTREGYSLINDLLESGGGVDVVEASAINDRREIVGLAKVDGQTRAVLLTPRPELQSIAFDSTTSKIKLAMSAMVPTRVKIESSSNLKDWTLHSSSDVTEAGVEVQIAADGGERFFRVVPE
jgi:probable HAF family extracellular repeat protein